jgi:hypothetical protein
VDKPTLFRFEQGQTLLTEHAAQASSALRTAHDPRCQLPEPVDNLALFRGQQGQTLIT